MSLSLSIGYWACFGLMAFHIRMVFWLFFRPFQKFLLFFFISQRSYFLPLSSRLTKLFLYLHIYSSDFVPTKDNHVLVDTWIPSLVEHPAQDHSQSLCTAPVVHASKRYTKFNVLAGELGLYRLVAKSVRKVLHDLQALLSNSTLCPSGIVSRDITVCSFTDTSASRPWSEEK